MSSITMVLLKKKLEESDNNSISNGAFMIDSEVAAETVYKKPS